MHAYLTNSQRLNFPFQNQRPAAKSKAFKVQVILFKTIIIYDVEIATI